LAVRFSATKQQTGNADNLAGVFTQAFLPGRQCIDNLLDRKLSIR
jgi:hypothetical protein